jgi:hypothetical protein
MRDMSALVVLVGIGNGALLAAIGLVLWGHRRRPLELTRAMVAVRWLAAALLLIGAVLAWMGESGATTPIPQLILMAALAALPDIHRHPANWRSTMLILPAFVLAGIGLLYVTSSASTAVQTTIKPVALGITICGGLGTRALGQALYWAAVPASRVVPSALGPSRESGTDSGEETLPPSPFTEGEEPGVQMESASAVTYALLTLLAGGVAIVHLWRQGTVSGATASAGGLAGVWLAWSAAWLGPRRPLRLRASLIIVAASSLILLAAVPSQ